MGVGQGDSKNIYIFHCVLVELIVHHCDVVFARSGWSRRIKKRFIIIGRRSTEEQTNATSTKQNIAMQSKKLEATPTRFDDQTDRRSVDKI